MQLQKKCIFLFLFFWVQMVLAQHYSIVIKGGHVIDPKNHINDTLDIGIQNGKIINLGKNIDPAEASYVVNASGMYVIPGLIDIHTHVFYGTKNGPNYCDGTESALPDSFSFRSGITTIVDAGSSGWRNFREFERKVIDRSQTRVLAFLNIVGSGMRGGGFEQNTSDMNAAKTAAIARKFSQYIVGIKVAHYSSSKWFAVDEGVKAAKESGLPVMIDFGSSSPPLSISDLLLDHLRSGDIFTHCFAQVGGRETLINPNTKKPEPFAAKAREKGIKFDVGYGKTSFDFRQAIPAIGNGFYPNSISTDMQNSANHDSVKNILNIMSKFLALGMKWTDVITACTASPAKEISHEELGQLSVGSAADLTILDLQNGKYGFYDYNKNEIEGTQRLECRMTIKAGKIVFCQNPSGRGMH